MNKSARLKTVVPSNSMPHFKFNKKSYSTLANVMIVH